MLAPRKQICFGDGVMRSSIAHARNVSRLAGAGCDAVEAGGRA